MTQNSTAIHHIEKLSLMCKGVYSRHVPSRICKRKTLEETHVCTNKIHKLESNSIIKIN